MPPPPGFSAVRAFPDSRPALERGGTRTRATGGWKMARRATSALAMLACLVLALPALILVSHQPAAAVTGQRAAAEPPVSIFITSMTPQWATPRSIITIAGTLRNNTKSPESQLTVQLLGSRTPVAGVTQLQADVSQPYSAATMQLPATPWRPSAPLAPRASLDWSIQVRASAIGMTTFGVYPVAAQLDQNGWGVATATTYLPYEPDQKGPYASSRPAPAKIAWLWPLIDVPLLTAPFQDSCSGPQASALAQSLGPGGRLGELVR